MKIEAKTIPEFFENSGAHRESLMQMDAFICEHFPKWDRKLYVDEKSCVLGYGEIPYKNTSYSGTLPIVSLAPQKNNISMYVMAWRDDQSLVEMYEDKLGKTSNGKGCIRFKKFENFDLEELKKFLTDTFHIYATIVAEK